MGWSIGWDSNWRRDIGYGVPARCDHPGCMEKIDRGLSYVCGNAPYGGDEGCGLYFCGKHSSGPAQLCHRCRSGQTPFHPKPDLSVWLRHKLNDETWKTWRLENPSEVEACRSLLKEREGA